MDKTFIDGRKLGGVERRKQDMGKRKFKGEQMKKILRPLVLIMR